ncbi:hypothetical protein C8J56DRAFT_954667 [Mycena floridula]|nr:hypothetical protein C8J56DRAFT_954667 [Mycena floridula]
MATIPQNIVLYSFLHLSLFIPPEFPQFGAFCMLFSNRDKMVQTSQFCFLSIPGARRRCSIKTGFPIWLLPQSFGLSRCRGLCGGGGNIPWCGVSALLVALSCRFMSCLFVGSFLAVFLDLILR